MMTELNVYVLKVWLNVIITDVETELNDVKSQLHLLFPTSWLYFTALYQSSKSLFILFRPICWAVWKHAALPSYNGQIMQSGMNGF